MPRHVGLSPGLAEERRSGPTDLWEKRDESQKLQGPREYLGTGTTSGRDRMALSRQAHDARGEVLVRWVSIETGSLVGASLGRSVTWSIQANRWLPGSKEAVVCCAWAGPRPIYSVEMGWMGTSGVCATPWRSSQAQQVGTTTYATTCVRSRAVQSGDPKTTVARPHLVQKSKVS